MMIDSSGDSGGSRLTDLNENLFHHSDVGARFELRVPDPPSAATKIRDDHQLTRTLACTVPRISSQFVSFPQ
jgi:hypothetical protein